MFGSIGKIYSDTVKNTLGGPLLGSSSSDDIKSFIPGIGDAMAAQKQNEMNIRAANKQMDFQERMSSSAYQRAMQDMKLAGLNPMLAFSQGGASSPSGALPQANSETKSKLGEFAMNSALGVKGLQTQQQVANTQQMQAESSIKLNNSTAAKQLAETENTQIDSVIKAKELPFAKLKGDISEKATKVIRQIIDSFSNSAKPPKRGEILKTIRKPLN